MKLKKKAINTHKREKDEMKIKKTGKIITKME